MGDGFHQAQRRVAFWGLLPIAGLQGLLLRRQALRQPPPPGSVSGAVGEGENLYLLALGDSIIAGIGATEREQTLPVQLARSLASKLGRHVRWHAEGENGANSSDVLVRLDALPSQVDADLVLISIGVNDVTGLRSTKSWRHNLQALIHTTRQRWPAALIVFAGLPPMEKFPLLGQPLRFTLGRRAAMFDHILQQVIGRHERVKHVPTRINPDEHGFCADGFHPSVESYAIWARQLGAELCAELTPQRLPVTKMR